jgi:hypothetical protein
MPKPCIFAGLIALAPSGDGNRIKNVASGNSCRIHPLRSSAEEPPLLTESQVQRSFRELFKSKDVSPEAFDKAEALLDELRAESPLRHRLSVELEDIRKLHTAKV